MADEIYGAKIPAPGRSVDSTIPDDFNYWSQYKALKRLLPLTYSIDGGPNLTSSDGLVPVTMNASVKTLTIKHNLGYIPIVEGRFNDLDGKFNKLPGITANDSLGTRAAYSNWTPNTFDVLIGNSGAPYSSQTLIVAVFCWIDPAGL